MNAALSNFLQAIAPTILEHLLAWFESASQPTADAAMPRAPRVRKPAKPKSETPTSNSLPASPAASKT